MAWRILLSAMRRTALSVKGRTGIGLNRNAARGGGNPQFVLVIVFMFGQERDGD
jgi:hypothetical protein